MSVYRDDSLPHQIRLTIRSSKASNIFVGCVCGAREILSAAGEQDHWQLYNQLRHRTTIRGAFTPVDPHSGRPLPAAEER